MGIEVALLAVTAAATVGSLYSQSRANKAAGKAAQAQRRQEALQAAIQRRQQQKEFRRSQALALQAGETQGVADSSGVQGGIGSLGSQFRANLSFLDQNTQLADFAGNMFDKAQRWNNRAQLFSGIAQLGMMGYETAAGDAAAQKAVQDTVSPAQQRFNSIFSTSATTSAAGRKGPL